MLNPNPMAVPRFFRPAVPAASTPPRLVLGAYNPNAVEQFQLELFHQPSRMLHDPRYAHDPTAQCMIQLANAAFQYEPESPNSQSLLDRITLLSQSRPDLAPLAQGLVRQGIVRSLLNVGKALNTITHLSPSPDVQHAVGERLNAINHIITALLPYSSI